MNNEKAWLKFEFIQGADETTRCLNVGHDGKIRQGTRIIDVVGELKQVPGLHYEFKQMDASYDPHSFVFVRDSIGRVVELYISYDETYADMPLAEFILRTLNVDTVGNTTLQVLTAPEE